MISMARIVIIIIMTFNRQVLINDSKIKNY